ncbi:MAG: hypothetical protein JNK11_07225 [Alphaproteobacteria bacterium]|nr:hypothetical protein [Alphaproteobacteria bacterium]
MRVGNSLAVLALVLAPALIGLGASAVQAQLKVVPPEQAPRRESSQAAPQGATPRAPQAPVGCDRFRYPDDRNYCKALETADVKQCGAIRALETRNLCIAVVNGDTKHCSTIKDGELKARCRSYKR